MDGRKTITGIIFAGIIALAVTACKVQPPGYVGLYVDNLTSVRDTIDPGEAPRNMVDTTITHVMYTTFVIEAEQPVLLRPAEDIFKMPSDSAYQYEVKKLLQVITDSIRLLRYQLFELRKQFTVLSETSFTVKELQEYQPMLSLPTKELATNQHDRDDPYTSIKNAMMIVAFYERGKIKPFQEASVLEKIKELCGNKEVAMITLSGYADSSGDEITNREITNKRLDYLSEMIIPYIAKEKIFFQNFGDIFASDTIVMRDRRIEIRIIIR